MAAVKVWTGAGINTEIPGICFFGAGKLEIQARVEQDGA